MWKNCSRTIRQRETKYEYFVSVKKKANLLANELVEVKESKGDDEDSQCSSLLTARERCGNYHKIKR